MELDSETPLPIVDREPKDRHSAPHLFVTTGHNETPALWEKALGFAAELGCDTVHRLERGMPALFAAHPEAQRAVVVQQGRLLLVDRGGGEFFQHPNMAFLRLGQIALGGSDTMIRAMELKAGDSLLDGTLGFAAEAILCAYVVGESGEVHGVEAVPELGLVVREGLQTVVTDREALNDAMRRVRVVHLGHHLEYLRACPDGRYDVIYFDPFFEEAPEGSLHFAPIRVFGDHARLLPETIAEARRVARRRVVVKSTRWGEALSKLGITERVDSRNGKVAYGIVRV